MEFGTYELFKINGERKADKIDGEPSYAHPDFISMALKLYF